MFGSYRPSEQQTQAATTLYDDREALKLTISNEIFPAL